MKKLLLSLAALATMAPLFAGTGTEADPYTCAEVLAMTGNATGYVKGYIVGYVTGQELAKGCHFEAAGAAAAKAYSNVIIADDVNCTDPAKVLPIQLVSKTDIRAQVNLGDNPGNYKKELSITGSLEKYFGVMGVKAPTAYTLSGEGGGDTPVTPPAPTEAVKVANIAAFLANPNTNDTYEFTSPVNVVYQCNYKSGSGNMTYNLYVQDATGGLLIFGDTKQTYKAGDVIPAGFTGKYKNYNGCVELVDLTGFAAASGTADVTAAEYAVEDLSTDNGNEYVLVKGVDIVAGADGKNFTVKQGEAEIPMYDKFDITVAAATNCNIWGVINVYKGKEAPAPYAQLYPIKITDASGSVVEAVAAPVFSVKAGAVEEGTEVAITCETEGATIHYTVDGTEPTEASATYSAPIVVDKEMTIKAIAVKEGLTNSVVVSAEYTIAKTVTVNAQIDFTNPSALDPSYDMSKAEDDGATGNKFYAVSDVWFTNGDLRVKGSISSTNTDARLYYQSAKDATQFRIYKGATLTVESTDKGISEVVITFNNGNNSAKQFDPALTATDDSNVYTYAVSPVAKTVTFTVGGSVQINKIGVVFDGGAGVEGVVAEDADAEVEYFNLQGVKVVNPENGLYIRRQGGKVEKVVVR